VDRIDLKRAQVLDALSHQCADQGENPLIVGQVMTAAPSCISPEMTAFELVRMFHGHEFRHLLVTDKRGYLLGVVSDRDVIRCFGPGDAPDRERLAQVTAAELMSTDVVTTSPQASLVKAVSLMLIEGISCLPVLTDGALVGILTNTDLHVVLQTLLQAVQFGRPAEAASVGAPGR